jgi:hypothetical protein
MPDHSADGGNGRRGRGSGRQGAKYRSTNQQLRMPRKWARSSSAFNFPIAAFNFRGFYKGKKTPGTTTTQIAQFYVQPSSGFCWIPPVVRRLFEVNSEPHTGARPSIRLCVRLIICFYWGIKRLETESYGRSPRSPRRSGCPASTHFRPTCHCAYLIRSRHRS